MNAIKLVKAEDLPCIYMNCQFENIANYSSIGDILPGEVGYMRGYKIICIHPNIQQHYSLVKEYDKKSIFYQGATTQAHLNYLLHNRDQIIRDYLIATL